MSAQRLLVTGSHGFVGSALAQALKTPGAPPWTLVELKPTLDLRDQGATREAIRAAKPDAVIHLAAQSSVPEAVRDPKATLDVNLYGTLHLLQALKAEGFAGRLLYVGTGDVYGLVPDEALPVVEARSPAPRNPYAVSKLAAEALCFQWFASEAMDIVLTRPFNHIGAGQSDRFALSDFARQIARIKSGRAPPVVTVGDIDVTRDFTAVDDVVQAYFSLLGGGAAGGIYNVCSGVERSVRSLLERLVALAGIEIRIDTDAARLRRAEQRRLCGDAGKIGRATGWEAATPLDRPLAEMLAYWENRDKHG